MAKPTLRLGTRVKSLRFARQKRRSGTAVVELAVCLPLLFTIIFGSIEACNIIALQQIISESAYDGALAALRPNASESDVDTNIHAVLAARNVTPQSVQIDGPGGISLAATKHGEPVTVTITVLTDGNVVGPQLFGLNTTLTAEATAFKQ